MAYKTSVLQYFFYFALILNFKLKKISKHAKKIYLADIKGLVTRRTIASVEFKVS
jgi:hypothetical protein